MAVSVPHLRSRRFGCRRLVSLRCALGRLGRLQGHGELLKRQVYHLLRRQPRHSRVAKTDLAFDALDKVV
jgi:hypothetical protein